MDVVCKDLSFAFVYLDNILITSSSPEEHCKHLCTLFQCLSDNGLLLNPAKCEFSKEEIDFLGYHISASGTRPNPSKVEAIHNLPSPTNCKELQQFTGMMNFYHRCILHLANIMHPLYNAMNKWTFTWTQELQYAFDQSKTTLTNATLLHHLPTALTTDASDTTIRAVEQQICGIWQPVAFYSRKLCPAETRYSTFDRELLAIYLAIQHFRHFLEEQPFTMYTNHKPLVQALTKQANPWSLRQQQHLHLTSYILHLTSPNFQQIYSTWQAKIMQLLIVSHTPFHCRNYPMDPNKLAKTQANDTTLQLQQVPFGPNLMLWCETSSNAPHLYLPSKWRKDAFNQLHQFVHPSVQSSHHMVSSCFVWLGTSYHGRVLVLSVNELKCKDIQWRPYTISAFLIDVFNTCL